MAKISYEMWKEAKDRLFNLMGKRLVSDNTVNSSVITALFDRYKSGERSEKLYNEIMKLGELR